jgi:hypothetical protein
MRLASIEQDYWELRSAEETSREHPETFWIPPREARENLRVGQAAKLIFDIEGVNQDGKIEIQGERIWVVVSERFNEFYIGILDGQPASIEQTEKTYLCFGAEIPFLPEHVIDIAEPPKEYVDWQLSQPPERKWSRE